MRFNCISYTLEPTRSIAPRFSLPVAPETVCTVVALLSLLVLPCSTLAARDQPLPRRFDVTQATVVWSHSTSGADSIDQQSHAAMVASIGFAVTKLDVRDLDNAMLDEHALLLVPHAAARLLSSRQARRIVGAMEKGLRLVTDGESPLLSALNVTLGEPHAVSVVIDQKLAGNRLHWSDRPQVNWITGSPGGHADTLYTDSATAHPLAVTSGFGKGGCIVLAPLLDPLSGNGYARFPTMANAIVQSLGCRPPFRRQGVDAYFDPGYRFSMPIDTLAALWRTWGIRAVHAAAWYYGDTPPYDYRKLIDAAHSNGILVYAWLEWPHVGKGFWDRHPEWRQKTALLQDAKLDWLLLMDLQDPDCMNAALDDLARELKLDWDGVDIAEFTITGAGGEALAGPSRPDYFTSFGPAMRREFHAVAGFDPLELEMPASEHYWQRDSVGLEEFYRYRTVVNNRLLRRVVEYIRDLEKHEKRDWELIHTIVDNSLHPEFDRLLGFDLQATLQLVREHGVTLNVEDPYMEWDEPPVRYRRLRETLLSLLPERPSMIDINVVPIHPPTQSGFASAQATGTEFLQQLQVASERHGRVCVYSEWTVFSQDWLLVPHAMACGATAKRSGRGWDISVPATVTWTGSGRGTVLDNGKPWPCRGPEGIVLPAGTHHLTFRKATARDDPPTRLRLVAISGELDDCKTVPGGFEVAYSSSSRCLVALSGLPGKIWIDGAETRMPVLKAGNSSVLLTPSGKHRLRVSGVGRPL